MLKLMYKKILTIFYVYKICLSGPLADDGLDQNLDFGGHTVCIAVYTA